MIITATFPHSVAALLLTSTLPAKWVQSLVGGKCWIPNNMYQTLSAETLFPSNHVEYEQLEDALIDQLLTAAIRATSAIRATRATMQANH